MTLKTSPVGRAVLIAREGCRLNAYLDSTGVPTIGVGHTGRASPPAVRLGMTITRAEADAYLAADLAPFEAAVNDAIKVSLADHEFDALVSFAFNIGVFGFAGSTAVRRLNGGDRAAAADALLLWAKPASLRTRREAERRQFLTSYATALPVARTGGIPVASSPAPAPAGPAAPAPKRLGWLDRLWIALTFRKAA